MNVQLLILYVMPILIPHVMPILIQAVRDVFLIVINLIQSIQLGIQLEHLFVGASQVTQYE